VFLSRNKAPPIDTIKQFLAIHGTTQTTQKFIRTDEGGELWGSHKFQQAIKDAGFIMEATAPDASFQNGLAERLNRTYGDMMRSLLHTANLGPEYWSWALLHATYLKNRIPHRTIGRSPYEAYTGKQPELTRLRVFGSPVIVRLPGRRQGKLDKHTTSGIFLGYTATSTNIYYRDNHTKRIKLATHVTFDEAGYTIPPHERTQLQHELQAIGTNPPEDAEITEKIISTTPSSNSPKSTICTTPITEPDSDASILKVRKLSPYATLPVQATQDAAGYDICSAVDITLPPKSLTKVKTDISVTPPEGTYCQLMSRRGLLTKYNIETKAGTIDRDYTGNVVVVLQNNSNEPYHVHYGNRISQMVIHDIRQISVQQTGTTPMTQRDSHGFGSTGNETISNPSLS
jgi:dUTP pyrophosphatase